jgi:hypothetical protein
MSRASRASHGSLASSQAPDGSDADALTAEEAAAEYRQKAKLERQEAKVKEWQRQLQQTLREDAINWEKVRRYMELSATMGEGAIDPNYEDSSMIGTIHQAAFAGHADIVQWCIDSKANVNARTALGRSPLHYACDGNRSAAARLLLREAADPNQGTLSMMTPLHICCQSGTYEVALVLLHEASTVIDVDAEDTKRRIPESLSKNTNITRAIRKYRNNLDEARKKDLQERALRRIFELFDVRGDGSIFPEEFADTQALLAQHCDHANDEHIDEIFAKADTNGDGKIDWEEFKAGYEELLGAIFASFRDGMQSLGEVEARLFEERVKIIQSGNDLESAAAQSPVITERAKQIAAARSPRTSTTRRKSIHKDEND